MDSKVIPSVINSKITAQEILDHSSFDESSMDKIKPGIKGLIDRNEIPNFSRQWVDEIGWNYFSWTFNNDYFLLVEESPNSWFYASKNYASDDNVLLYWAIRMLQKVISEAE